MHNKLRTVEPLEARRLLTIITGSVFDDVNGDSVRSEDELGLTGWEVTLESLDSDLVVRQTTDHQQFSFPNLPGGRYKVTLDASDRWDLTFADEVSVDAALAEMRLDLGVRLIEELRDVRFGDIDTNLDTFTLESDIVQAFKSGKYDAEEPAKWEDGDWNRDGRFNSGDLIGFAESFNWSHVDPASINHLQPLSEDGEADVLFRYDATSGDVSIVTSGFELSTIQLRTRTPIMDFDRPRESGGLYELYRADRFLYFTLVHPNIGLNEFHWPRFATPGLSSSTILDQLMIDGSRVTGGGLGNVVLDCVGCHQVPQTTVTAYTFHDSNGDGSSWREDSIRGMTLQAQVDGQTNQVVEIGARYDTSPTPGRFVFPTPTNVPLTIELDAPAGWRLADPAQELHIANPDGEQIHVDIALIKEPIRVTEVHYHPAADGLSEFLEVANFGDRTVNIAGMKVDGAVEFAFPAAPESILQPGQHVVVVSDLETFKRTYPDPSIVIAGQYDGRLSNGGESFRLTDEFGNVFHRITYLDEWLERADGRGPSLTIVDPDDERAVDEDDWRLSAVDGGTPGRPAFAPGDANTDGIFNSTDLVDVFIAAEFEDDRDGNSTWAEGDWDGDGDFTTADLVMAFQSGKYTN